VAFGLVNAMGFVVDGRVFTLLSEAFVETRINMKILVMGGRRLMYPMHGRAMKIANFLGNKGFCYLASWVMRQRVSDTVCGTKVFFKRDFLRMPLGGRERWGDFDLLFGTARLKLRILEIPVHNQERRPGKSKMLVMRDGWLFLRACWHGWRMPRFPQTVLWTQKQELFSGWYEVLNSAVEGTDAA